MVPLRNCNLPLTPAEVDSFRATFSGEKSFRGEYADRHRQIVALQARLLVEMAEFKGKQDSAYFWKPHADSLTYLLTSAQRAVEATQPLLQLAQQRGLMEKVTAMNASLQRLQREVQRAIQLLEQLSPRKPAW